MGATLLDRADRWAQHDPDPTTQAEVRALCTAARGGDTKAQNELNHRPRMSINT
jgi:phosphomannomutase